MFQNDGYLINYYYYRSVQPPRYLVPIRPGKNTQNQYSAFPIFQAPMTPIKGDRRLISYHIRIYLQTLYLARDGRNQTLSKQMCSRTTFSTLIQM